ncbi:hypothetical protein V6N00_13755 [Tersicoccus sp. MR15.9]|uniref:hypothetical protein n=1 Tax=Tersicoccus mangrovi TaxID=3121635 RepID=UPI002FE69051
MSNDQARHPAGTPASMGGKFAPDIHGESAVALADPDTVPVDVAPGDSYEVPGFDHTTGIEQVSVTRSEDEPPVWFVDATRYVNFHDLLQPEQPLSEEAMDTYLNRHQGPIAEFMRDRYDVELNGDDWDAQEATASVRLDAAPTPAEAGQKAWEQTRIVALANESDPGTFGSPYLGRMLREHLQASSTVAQPFVARAEAARMSPTDIDRMVYDRFGAGKGEISDGCAMAIARAFAEQPGADRPVLAKLGEQGHCTTEAAFDELRAIFASVPDSSRDSIRTNMLFTWLLNGGTD